MVGDIHPAAFALSGAYTPVPGGVGALTIAMLMQNTVTAAKLRRGLPLTAHKAPEAKQLIVLRVGLTGGLGSGKSTAAGLFAGFGAHILEADAIARALMQPGEPVYAAIVARFGPSVVLARWRHSTARHWRGSPSPTAARASSKTSTPSSIPRPSPARRS